MIGVAADFKIDALAADAFTGHGRNDLPVAGFPAVSAQRTLLHHGAAGVGNGKRRIQQDAPFLIPFIEF